MGVYRKLKGLETDDYQKRNSQYPKSGVLDSIRVKRLGIKIVVSLDFKNTSEKQVKYYRNAENNSSKMLNITAEQTGDYWGDWVTLKVAYKRK